MFRATSNEGFGCRNKGSQRAFHVCRTAAIEQAVSPGRLEWVALPLIERPGRNNVGMPGKAEQGDG